MPLSIQQVVARVEGLKARYQEKDQRNSTVAMVRAGRLSKLVPAAFTDEWPEPVVANLIDTGARDLAEVTGSLPSITCSTSKIAFDAARQRADKRTRVANWYVTESGLGKSLPVGCDHYYTYGLGALRVEPHPDEDRPQITVEDTLGGYPQVDSFGKCIAYARRFSLTAGEITSMFPDSIDWFNSNARKGTWGQQDEWSNNKVELISYDDKDQRLLYCYHPHDLAQTFVLKKWDNPLGKCMVIPVIRPSLDGQIRGQFDAAVYIFAARAAYARLALTAATDAVNAPIVVPQDVQTLPLGPKSLIRARDGVSSVGRVRLELPNGVFAQDQLLEQELRNAIRYPESRSGNVDASIITGRGVDALQGGFDTQVAMAQLQFAYALTQAIELCFEMDEKLWPNKTRSIRGLEAGSPYEMSYTPAKDIKGDYTVDVTYGLLAGMDPNRSLVWTLQALGAQLVSKDFARRNLPSSMNVTEEEKLIDIENMRDTLLEGLQATAQAIPAMAAQGQDPTSLISSISAAIKARREGKQVEDAVLEALAPKNPPPGESGPPGSEPPTLPGAPGSGAAPGGEQLPGSAVPGRPSLQQLVAGIGQGGSPNLSSSVIRRSTV